MRNADERVDGRLVLGATPLGPLLTIVGYLALWQLDLVTTDMLLRGVVDSPRRCSC